MSSRPDRDRDRPGSFQGWQRGACLVGVALLVVLTVLLLLFVVLGILGVR